MSFLNIVTIGVVVLVCVAWIWPLQRSWYTKILLCLLACLAPGKLYFHLIFGGDPFEPNIPWNLSFLLDISRSTLLFLAVFVVLRIAINCLTRLIRFNLRAVAIPAQSSAWALAMFVLSCALGMYGTTCAYKTPELKQYSMVMDNLDARLDGLTIVQLSDLHICGTSDALQLYTMVKAVNALHPDLILITGDIVDGAVEKRRPYTDLLFQLKSTYGTFIVSGNHEYYSGYSEWQDYFIAGGMHSLDNRAISLKDEKGQILFNLGGITDPIAHRYHLPMPQVESVLSAINNDAPTIMLSHRPNYAPEMAASKKVDLIFAGHTHGGLVKGVDRLVAKYNGGFVSGYYDVNGTPLIVSNGTMTWMGLPLRIGVPGQIVKMTLGSKVQGAPDQSSLTSRSQRKHAQQEQAQVQIHNHQTPDDNAAPQAKTAPAQPKNQVVPKVKDEQVSPEYTGGIQLIIPMHDLDSDEITESVTNLAVLPSDLNKSQIARIEAIINEENSAAPSAQANTQQKGSAQNVARTNSALSSTQTVKFSIEDLEPSVPPQDPAQAKSQDGPGFSVPSAPPSKEAQELPKEASTAAPQAANENQSEPVFSQATAFQTVSEMAQEDLLLARAYTDRELIEEGPYNSTLEIQAVYSISLNPELFPADMSVTDLLLK